MRRLQKSVPHSGRGKGIRMVTVFIDNRETDAPQGSTILDAARALGISIPTLCYLEGRTPNTSCMVCLVKIKGQNNLVPACATPVFENMEVESETEEVFQARKTALELLLSEHGGECFAPCHNACPAGMDIPLVIRQIGEGALEEAIRTIRKDIALPAVMGRACSAPCEKGCHRTGYDNAVSICKLERYAADRDLALSNPYLPERRTDRGKRAAVVGAGPTGLAAAYHLRLEGYQCTVFDERDKAGGSLRSEVSEQILPRDVLQKELDLIEKLGVQFRLGIKVGDDISFEDLQKDFDVVLLTLGVFQLDQNPWLSPIANEDGVKANKNTFETSIPGVFAAGSVLRPEKLLVRALAQGKQAAQSIVQYLSGEPVSVAKKPYALRLGKLSKEDLEQFLESTSSAERTEPSLGVYEGYLDTEVQAEVQRCNRCGCDSLDRCKLRQYAEQYGAQPGRFRGKRRPSTPVYQHPNIIYDSGKCILCGICVQITRDSSEKLGLAFTGRGYDVRVDVPFGESLQEGLTHTASECVSACPSGALEFRTGIDGLKICSQTEPCC